MLNVAVKENQDIDNFIKTYNEMYRHLNPHANSLWLAAEETFLKLILHVYLENPDILSYLKSVTTQNERTTYIVSLVTEQSIAKRYLDQFNNIPNITKQSVEVAVYRNLDRMFSE